MKKGASFEFGVGGFGRVKGRGVSPAQRTLEARSPSKDESWVIAAECGNHPCKANQLCRINCSNPPSVSRLLGMSEVLTSMLLSGSLNIARLTSLQGSRFGYCRSCRASIPVHDTQIKRLRHLKFLPARVLPRRCGCAQGAPARWFQCVWLSQVWGGPAQRLYIVCSRRSLLMLAAGRCRSPPLAPRGQSVVASSTCQSVRGMWSWPLAAADPVGCDGGGD